MVSSKKHMTSKMNSVMTERHVSATRTLSIHRDDLVSSNQAAGRRPPWHRLWHGSVRHGEVNPIRDTHGHVRRYGTVPATTFQRSFSFFAPRELQAVLVLGFRGFPLDPQKFPNRTYGVLPMSSCRSSSVGIAFGPSRHRRDQRCERAVPAIHGCLTSPGMNRVWLFLSEEECPAPASLGADLLYRVESLHPGPNAAGPVTSSTPPGVRFALRGSGRNWMNWRNWIKQQI